MLDCQLYGLRPGGHHLTNVLLHGATAVLLYLVLREMSGSLWRSAFVATIFAIHPLRVESVAWVAERKDVLSGLFFVLTIWAYFRYARRPWSLVSYGLVVGLFALGLLCKPMVVTLPFVLLLLDYWPHNRLRAEAAGTQEFCVAGISIPRRPILDKLPLLAMSASVCVVTILAQTHAIQSTEAYPIPQRFAHAVLSCVIYLRQMVYPAGLSAFYRYPSGGLDPLKIMFAAALLIGFSLIAVVQWQSRPWMLVGWFWYLTMLVPVLGIVQVGAQAHADRFTYLPQIGIYLAVTWSVADWAGRWKHGRAIMGLVTAVVIGVLIVCAHVQTSYWKNSETLWNRALACNPRNDVAHYNLGDALSAKGEEEKADAEYQTAVEINPSYVKAQDRLGIALAKRGRLDEAIADFRKSIEADHNDDEAHNNLGIALGVKGDVDGAISEYRKALAINPDYVDARYNLGLALLGKRQLDEAIDCFKQTLAARPQFAGGYADLGAAYRQKGEARLAVDSWQQSLAINSNQLDVQNNLAWLLATSSDSSLRNGARAVELAEATSQATGRANPMALRTLAAAYAEAGRFGDATVTARSALELAETQKNTALVSALQEEIKLYGANAPLRQALNQ